MIKPTLTLCCLSLHEPCPKRAQGCLSHHKHGHLLHPEHLSCCIQLGLGPCQHPRQMVATAGIGCLHTSLIGLSLSPPLSPPSLSCVCVRGCIYMHLCMRAFFSGYCTCLLNILEEGLAGGQHVHRGAHSRAHQVAMHAGQGVSVSIIAGCAQCTS